MEESICAKEKTFYVQIAKQGRRAMRWTPIPKHARIWSIAKTENANSICP